MNKVRLDGPASVIKRFSVMKDAHEYIGENFDIGGHQIDVFLEMRYAPILKEITIESIFGASFV